MYTEQKNSKKLKALYEQSLHIKSAIPHPLIMGVIRGEEGRGGEEERRKGREKGRKKSNSLLSTLLIGASLSEPHTNVTALHTCVCMYVCLSVCLRPYTENFK